MMKKPALTSGPAYRPPAPAWPAGRGRAGTARDYTLYTGSLFGKNFYLKKNPGCYKNMTMRAIRKDG